MASSSPSSEDTIFALSTGNAGPAGVAVVRISGPRSKQVLEALTAAPATAAAIAKGITPSSVTAEADARQETSTNCPRESPPFPAPRRAVVRRLYDPMASDLLDEALVLWMPGPRR